MPTLIAILMLSLSPAHAEYRAFELVIRDQTSGQERVALSTLDPNQYRRYYPMKLSESVYYRSTWMCKGNTSQFKIVCTRPESAKVLPKAVTPPAKI